MYSSRSSVFLRLKVHTYQASRLLQLRNRKRKSFHLYSLASQVSALATLGSLPFGKATHASVVLPSILGFLRTCVHLYADASKSARASGISSVFFTYPKFPPIKHQKIDKIFLDFHSYTSLSQKDFFRLFYSVFCVSKPIPIKHHDFYSCVSEDRFFAHFYSHLHLQVFRYNSFSCLKNPAL